MCEEIMVPTVFYGAKTRGKRSRVKMLEKKFCLDRVMRIEKVLKMASRTVDQSH